MIPVPFSLSSFPMKPECTLELYNLPPGSSIHTICNYFMSYGVVDTGILHSILSGPTLECTAYLIYQNPQSVPYAAEQTNGLVFDSYQIRAIPRMSSTMSIAPSPSYPAPHPSREGGHRENRNENRIGAVYPPEMMYSSTQPTTPSIQQPIPSPQHYPPQQQAVMMTVPSPTPYSGQPSMPSSRPHSTIQVQMYDGSYPLRESDEGLLVERLNHGYQDRIFKQLFKAFGMITEVYFINEKMR